MNDERRAILLMLAGGRINADEAVRLIAVLEKSEPTGSPPPAAQPDHNGAPNWLRAPVDTDAQADRPTHAIIPAPISLLNFRGDTP